MSEEEIETLQDEIRKLRNQSMTISNIEQNGSGIQHKIIDDNKLIDYLNQGWEMVKELSRSRISGEVL